MEGLCAELHHHHKFHPSHQLYKKSLRDIDIPPRKLFSRRSTLSSIDPVVSDVQFMDSPKSGGLGTESDTLFQKFLPYNSLDDDDDADPYSSDHFRMYEFKVRRCTRSRSHDWTDCPFAHPGEKARRRDPRRFHYSGTVCSEFRKGNCSRGENCEFAHGVFECWLHPTRYRTEACKDGKNCKRKICFFAHTPRQLRVLPPGCYESGSSPKNLNSPLEKKYRNLNHCCVFCHSVSASPTSTLIGMSHISPPMSPSLSPPLSPANRNQFSSPMSRYTDRFGSVESSSGMGQLDPSGLMSCKDALTDLVSSLEAMNVNHEPNSSAAAPASHSHSVNFDGNLPWLDVNFSNNNSYDDDQQQFLLSPSTPSPSPISSSRTKFYTREFPSPTPVSRLSFAEEPNNNNAANRYYSDNGLGGGPDLAWVNDLLT